MNKLKDFFYDKNDILVAFIILVVAALIVLWRVNAIMEYPSTLVASAGENSQMEPQNHNSEAPVTTDSAITSGGGIEGNGQDEVEICAVYVNYGESLDVVAANCVTAGLIGSTEEFMNIVNSMGAAGSIQAGQHHIPSDVTPEELIGYLTQPGL